MEGIDEKNVDDILDEIIENEVVSDGVYGRIFKYDGDKQSFEVRITTRQVNL
jgi:hypothetical protein